MVIADMTVTDFVTLLLHNEERIGGPFYFPGLRLFKSMGIFDVVDCDVLDVKQP